jgi:general secretion pathway protein G
MFTDNRKSGGFTLLEMMLVVVIIALIAAIAIPKFSRGAAGANDSSVAANLAVLRNAVDMFQVEHGNTYPTVATFVAQMTQYTDAVGNAQATKDATHIYGPYLRSVPALPVGAAKGSTGVAAAAGTGVGWIYSATVGTIQTNTTATEVDSTGKTYSSY